MAVRAGIERRLARVLKRGRSLIVALDHGMSLGPMEGIEDAVNVARRVIEAGADAVIVGPAVAGRIAGAFPDAGIILKANAVSSLYADPEDLVLLFGPEDAVKLDADAISYEIYFGISSERERIKELSRLIAGAHDLGIPVIVHAYAKARARPKEIAVSVRVAYELGADLIKTFYVGGREVFSRIVRSVDVPVVIAGGPKSGSVLDLLKLVKDALEAGAVGVAFGRNIWQRENPEGVVRALRLVIHENADPEEAIEATGV